MSLRSWLEAICGRRKSGALPGAADVEREAGLEPVLAQTYSAREAYAQALGEVSPDVLAPIVNPTFMGGPKWPNLRQAWRVIRRGRNTILLSDGLSDPFDDVVEPNVGLGVEVLVETADPMGEALQTRWLFDLVYQVSQQFADHGGMRELMDRYGLMSFELPVSDVLRPAESSNGTAGVLFGVVPPEFGTEFAVPGGSVRVVTAKLLWPSELAFAIAEKKAGREELARRFAADGTHHRSSMLRKAVV